MTRTNSVQYYLFAIILHLHETTVLASGALFHQFSVEKLPSVEPYKVLVDERYVDRCISVCYYSQRCWTMIISESGMIHFYIMNFSRLHLTWIDKLVLIHSSTYCRWSLSFSHFLLFYKTEKKLLEHLLTVRTLLYFQAAKEIAPFTSFLIDSWTSL